MPGQKMRGECGWWWENITLTGFIPTRTWFVPSHLAIEEFRQIAIGLRPTTVDGVLTQTQIALCRSRL